MKSYYRILRLNHGRAPTVQHATLKEAETEALRLAGQHPGEQFEILQCLAIAQTSQPSLFWCDWVEPPIQAVSLAPKPDLPVVGVLCGDGYRFLEPREVIEEGDEVYFEWDNRWDRYLGCAIGQKQAASNIGRRKLPEAPPAHYPTTPLPEGFNRWECRGTGWDPGFPVTYVHTITPDHTRFGNVCSDHRPWGNPATEYWEAVKDEPSYRILEPGEQVLEGDEFYRTSSNEWVPTVCRNSHDYRVQSNDVGCYRRPTSSTPKA